MVLNKHVVNHTTFSGLLIKTPIHSGTIAMCSARIYTWFVALIECLSLTLFEVLNVIVIRPMVGWLFDVLRGFSGAPDQFSLFGSKLMCTGKVLRSGLKSLASFIRVHNDLLSRLGGGFLRRYD